MGNTGRGQGSDHYGLTLSFCIIALFFFPSLTGQSALPDIEVSVSSRNRTINHVLDEITFQTGYHFTFDAGLISGKKRVQWSASSLPLKDALDSLFRNPQFNYKVIDRNFVIYEENEAPPNLIHEEIDRVMVKGIVVDSRSKKGLAYATIGLDGSSLGSICNQDGEFTFKIPGSLSDPVLIISYMGYKREFVPVIYPIDEEIVVLLEKEMIPLQEVIIRYADPKKLLMETLSRIPDNYMDDHSTMTAFYRESVTRNEHCLTYLEAVLDVAKTPYNKYTTSDKVRIRKGRKVTDVTSKDTLLIKLRSGIFTSLSLDVVKNRPDFLDVEFMEKYDLKFIDMMTYRDRLVYVISFQQKSNIPYMLFRGQLYLDHENMALLAADFEYNPLLIQEEPELFVVSRSPSIRIKPTQAKYHVDYREWKGQYYLSQIRGEVEMKARKRRQWMGAKYRISLEMAITDVIPGQRLRIAPSERVNPHRVLSDEIFEFDPLFWGIYNVIRPEASLVESIQRIEENLKGMSE